MARDTAVRFAPEHFRGDSRFERELGFWGINDIRPRRPAAPGREVRA
jgi:hypothetical protein